MQPSTIESNRPLSEDTINANPQPPAPDNVPEVTPPLKRGPLKQFFAGYWRHKLWTLPLTVLILVGAMLAVPASRYPILGLGLQRSFAVTVVDSKTGTPVSGAQVRLAGKVAITSSAGKASIRAKVGTSTIQITKQYYQSSSLSAFIGISGAHNAIRVQLTATGRQVPITVVNKITGKAVANAEIKILDTEAQTNAQGKTTIVLPTGAATQPGTLTATGYNQAVVHIQVTDQVVAVNTFSLTPAGKVYFLSNLSGALDVVSTNLDGTDRKTVPAGTGNESTDSTALIPSRDWKYLTLLSRRDGGAHAKLFVINTATGQTTAMDTDTADFSPIGWSGHYFVYEASIVNTQSWQSGKSTLRSYNADSAKVTTIDQTSAQGTVGAYIASYFGFANIVSDRVVYGFGWNDFNSNYLPNNLGGQKLSLMSANVDGSKKQDLRDIAIANGTTYAYTTATLHTPQELYIQTVQGLQNSVYYIYEYQNNSVTQSSTLTDVGFELVRQSPTTYLLSPSGNTEFWSEQRDGKNTLFTGDASGANDTQVATQSDYQSYAWASDNYLLVEKGGNELYVMPVSGGTPLKVSDYYQPIAYGYDAYTTF